MWLLNDRFTNLSAIVDQIKGAKESADRAEKGVEQRRQYEGVMQKQKAENTGRQFCSCFYQLLGIGGPEARPWQNASWGVRVGTYVSLAYTTSLSFFLTPSFFLFFRCPSFPPPLFPLFGEPVFFLHLGRLDDSFLPRVHPPFVPVSLPSRARPLHRDWLPSGTTWVIGVTLRDALATWYALYLRTVRAPWRRGGRPLAFLFSPCTVASLFFYPISRLLLNKRRSR